MKLLKILIGCEFLAEVVGCGTPLVWYQEGKTYSDAARDFRACEYEALQRVHPVRPAYSGSPFAADMAAVSGQGTQRYLIIKQCMEHKGHRQVPASEIKAMGGQNKPVL